MVLEGVGVCLGSAGRTLYPLFLASAMWRLLDLPQGMITPVRSRAQTTKAFMMKS